jgi:hypothetical protein
MDRHVKHGFFYVMLVVIVLSGCFLIEALTSNDPARREAASVTGRHGDDMFLCCLSFTAAITEETLASYQYPFYQYVPPPRHYRSARPQRCSRLGCRNSGEDSEKL